VIHASTRRASSAQTHDRSMGDDAARVITRTAGMSFSLRTAAGVLLGVVLAASLAACGAPRLEADTPTNIDLAGQWRLNRQASEDPRALIAKLQEKVAKQMRRNRPEDDLYGEEPGSEGGPASGGPGGRGGYGGRNEGGEARGSRGGANSQSTDQSSAPDGGWRSRMNPNSFLRVRYDAALGSRLSGDGLTIEQSPDRFAITRGDSRRSYTPGVHSVVSVTDGVADQTSGWKGREYVIDVKPQVGPHLTERYGLTADGQLIEKVSLNESGLPKLEFTRVYERGAAPPRGLPTSN